MPEHTVDLATWPRADTFRLFRSYDRPHFAVTARLDATRLIRELKPAGVSPYRACLYAIGAGIHAVDAFRMRFRGDGIVLHDAIDLSMTVPRHDGSFGYAYVPFDPDWPAFDAKAGTIIAEVAAAGGLAANTGQRDDLAYLSCLPWLDFTALDNALPGPHDCIPRFSWGKFVDEPSGRVSFAMAVQVHHALVDGIHVGQFFAAAQAGLEQVAPSAQSQAVR